MRKVSLILFTTLVSVTILFLTFCEWFIIARRFFTFFKWLIIARWFFSHSLIDWLLPGDLICWVIDYCRAIFLTFFEWLIIERRFTYILWVIDYCQEIFSYILWVIDYCQAIYLYSLSDWLLPGDFSYISTGGTLFSLNFLIAKGIKSIGYIFCPVTPIEIKLLEY